MSIAPNPSAGPPEVDQHGRRFSQLIEEVARLGESNLAPPAFSGEMLKRLLEGLAAPAGAVWLRNAQGHLLLQYQINVKEIGLDQNEERNKIRSELLRQVTQQARGMHLPPRSGGAVTSDGQVSAGNPSDYFLLLMPIVLNKQVAGLIEVWQHPDRTLQVINGQLSYLALMADISGRYLNHHAMGQLSGQQQIWMQLEVFARQVHASLHPKEVAYHVANEGRRLIDCDRVSVAVRNYGSKAKIEAVSGADVVETRSNLIQLMRALCEQVVLWGDKLVFNGTRDDSLPPKVLSALDAYLAESNSKLLVVQPLRDERESGKRPPRSAVLMECFEPPSQPQQLLGRLEVLTRHAAPALYNAVEHRRIPGRLLWQPLAALQEGVGGKAKALTALAVGLLSFLVAVLLLVPYELKLEAHGKLVPWARRGVYPPTPGIITEFKVEPGSVVPEDGVLAVLYSTDLHKKLAEMQEALFSAEREAEAAIKNADIPNLSQKEKIANLETAATKKQQAQLKRSELDQFLAQNNAHTDPTKYGYFYLRAPSFSQEEHARVGEALWTVLSGNFRDEWLGKTAKPSDAVLKLGAKDGPWEIELRIPQKHISQVLKAYQSNGGAALDIDFILRSDATRTYRGILARERIASEAIPNRDEKDESEPEVIAYVNIDDESIDPDYRLPRQALTSGTEVHAKARCGKHRLGYSLFYGVWEFVYEKIVFFF